MTSGVEEPIFHESTFAYKEPAMKSGQGEATSQATANEKPSVNWQILWFLPHLVVVYGVLNFCAPWLARQRPFSQVLVAFRVRVDGKAVRRSAPKIVCS